MNKEEFLAMSEEDRVAHVQTEFLRDCFSTIRSLSGDIGVSTATIHKYLHVDTKKFKLVQERIIENKNSKLSPEGIKVTKEIAGLILSGLTIKEIADITGYSPTKVRYASKPEILKIAVSAEVAAQVKATQKASALRNLEIGHAKK